MEDKEKKNLEKGEEDLEEKDCPLSREGWIMFLGDEIYRWEHTNNRDGFTQTIMLFIVFLLALTNWIFAARSTNLPEYNINQLIFGLQLGIYIIAAFFLVYLLLPVYDFLIHRPKIQKRVKALEEFREEIISGGLTDPNKIDGRWKEIYETLYPKKKKRRILYFLHNKTYRKK